MPVKDAELFKHLLNCPGADVRQAEWKAEQEAARSAAVAIPPEASGPASSDGSPGTPAPQSTVNPPEAHSTGFDTAGMAEATPAPDPGSGVSEEQ